MSEDGVSQAGRFLDWMIAEREQADPLVEKLLDLPPSAWQEWLTAHPEAVTVQFFEGLLKAAESPADPSRSLALTALILGNLDGVQVPPGAELAETMLRGDVWRARASALQQSGDARAALRAYEMSAAMFRAEPVAFEEAEEAERAADALRGDAGAVARLLDETEIDLWIDLASRDELQGPGALADLSREMTARTDRAPREAIMISELVTEIADRLPASLFPAVVRAQLRARAWKDRAMALRQVARYAEALLCLDRAARLLEPFPRLDHDRAGVWLARATVLQEANRVEESAPFIAAAKSVYERHGDRRRLLACCISEGALLHRMQKYGEAIPAYEACLPLATELNDLDSVAVLHNNIGHSATESGDFALAAVHLDRAVALFEKLGQPLRAARSALARGRMLVRKGDWKHGISYLRAVREEFLQHEMVEEAGLCGLDMVKAELARGKSQEAETLARQIVREFTEAGLNRRAITAVAHLSEAIEIGRASGTTVENVREFICVLRNNPDAEFLSTA